MWAEGRATTLSLVLRRREEKSSGSKMTCSGRKEKLALQAGNSESGPTVGLGSPWSMRTVATDGVHGPEGSSRRHGGDRVCSERGAWEDRVSSWDGDPGPPPQLQTLQDVSFERHFWGHVSHPSHCHTSEADSRAPIFKLRRTPATIPS